MANRHGNPARVDNDSDALKAIRVRTRPHTALAECSDDVQAATMQLAEVAMLYEMAKARESYTALRGINNDMRVLQDKVRDLIATEHARERDSMGVDVSTVISAIESLPETQRIEILSAFEAPLRVVAPTSGLH